MTSSMTAFARLQSEHDWGSLVWEIRSVNHRYLEPSVRLPDTLRNLEGQLRELLRNGISRGKVEAHLKFTPAPGGGVSLQLNEQVLSQLLEAERGLRARVAEAAPVNTLELLKWPGALAEQEQDTNAIEQETLALFQRSLDTLQAQREREGAELANLIRQRLRGVEAIIADIRQALPEILDRQKERIQQLYAQLKLDADPARLEQEIVLLLQKADIHEELDRLATHVREVGRTLSEKGPVGRRLDFLMQELNREANTIGSKAVVTETTMGAVELKVLIEQMREQIQNIE